MQRVGGRGLRSRREHVSGMSGMENWGTYAFWNPFAFDHASTRRSDTLSRVRDWRVHAHGFVEDGEHVSEAVDGEEICAMLGLMYLLDRGRDATYLYRRWT